MTSDDSLRALFASTTKSVLVTVKRDGRPQLSNVMHGWYPDEQVARISVTADRAKTRNALRDPRVSLYVTSPDFWSYAVLEGTAELTPVASEPGDPAMTALIDLYRTINGEHEDWDDYTRAMIADHRQVLTVRPSRFYGQARG
ncbi:PPOX class F420-dependent oxidoreductase [Gordonia sp. NPDC003424]